MNQMSPAHPPAPVATGRTLTAPLGFTVPQDEKPVFHSSALTGGAPKIFFQIEEIPVALNDMRPIAGELELDRHGFKLLQDETAVDDLYDDDAVTTTYYAEVIELVKQAVGATHVAIFDHTRRSDSGAGAKNKDGNRGPAARVHVDYTAASGPKRGNDALGAGQVEEILAKGGRVVQINVWRPITGPVQRAPLALADAQSIAPDALLATDQVFPDRVGEIYQLAHQPGQRWYWAPEMARDEVLLIKGWDTKDGVAKYTPHGAFQIPDQDPAAPPRESIEVRTFAVIEG
ncbi:MAG: CmcJ/NvfI family oxidoreductase [Thalassobaculaceae bacterium]|nr:CmcJ/NvfI family oxidoreductase [Thalassobaculaceae bacterium]